MKDLDYKSLKIGVNVLKKDVLVYKKLRNAICQMVLSKGTKVMKTRNRLQKLRADQAIPIMIVPYRAANWYDRKACFQKLDFKSGYNPRIGKAVRMKYMMGELVIPNGFDTDKEQTCGKGIHFFCTIQRAMNYN